MIDPPPHTNDVSTVNHLLKEFFEDSIRRAAEFDSSYERLWHSLYDLITSGGKRFRPAMTLMAYRAFGGQNIGHVIPIAAAGELLHFSLLIHDDVIDRDYVRYGVPNIAGRYQQTYASHAPSPDNLTHYAHSAAILGGDLMLSGAYQLVASSGLPDTDRAEALRLLSDSVFQVAGGELLDTELSFMPYRVGDALKVADYKTASYSFVLPLLTGATLAGASASQKETLRSYAYNLGIAFQLADDLLGVFGDAEQTGKSTVGDIIEGKRTYMVEQAFAAFSSKERETFMSAFGNASATTKEIEISRSLLESSGARTATEQKVSAYAEKARQALDELRLPPEHHQNFSDMIAKVADRSS